MSEQDPQIKIEVETQFLPDHVPEKPDNYAFAYRIVIRNLSSESVKLLNRYWLITDANGKKTEVSGPGVVGEQPDIPAGKSYRYTSGAILETPMGTMEGHYEMERKDGSLFKAPIGVFSLAIPNLIN